ncbi:testis-specific serine/threonine-protein kinase 3-like [Apostichopus japonicus]|uniref:testis-specific serine/threonine-protein kinase 3-like n=1 Tax=Stichopus japonicus TaxID=307972 RepID=UPI003AB3769E
MDRSYLLERGYSPIETLRRRASGAQIVLARCQRSNREVVLKFKRTGPLGNEVDQNDITGSIQNEANILANLDHVNIIQFIDLFKVGKNPVMVMEHAMGGTLATLIRTNRKLRNDLATKLTNQLAKAIIFLHNHNIAHCDIKSENILLDGEKNVKLCDFGFAEDVRIHSDGEVVWKGSVAFSSPEGITRVSRDLMAGDVWSFGVVVFNMVTGYLPFGSQGVADILHRIGEPLRWPRPLKTVNDRCREFVEMVLERDVAKRQTMEQLKDHPWLL